MSNNCDQFKIALTLAKLALLRDMNVPPPARWTFSDFSVRSIAGDRSVKGDGFPLVTWGWDIISRASLFRLISLCGTNASVSLFMRSRINLSAGGIEWASFSAVMDLPDLSGNDGSPVGQSAEAFQGVTIRFRGLVLQ